MASCDKAPDADRAQRLSDGIDVAVQQVPVGLDPLNTNSLAATQILYNIHDTLIEVDYRRGFALKPGLATSWRRIDPLTLEVTLRQGVVFHDGSPMTASDVAFSFSAERMGPGTPGHALAREYLGPLSAVEIVGPHTVVFRTDKPDPVLEYRLSSWTSQIVSRRAFRAAADWQAWSRAPVGAGPFKVVDYGPNERVVLDAHDRYWQGAPSVRRLTFVAAPELSSRIAGLAAGDYDLIAGVAVDQIADVQRFDGLHVVGGPVMNHRVIKFDMDNPALSDPRIRRAIGLAIDRRLIVATLQHGRGAVPNGHQWPAFGDLYDPDRQPPRFDPREAGRLLAEAGYDGRPIAYRIQPNYYPGEMITAQALVQMWRDVGLNIRLEIKENWSQVFAEPGTGLRNGSDPPLFPDPLASVWRAYGDRSDSVEHWRNDAFSRLGGVLATNFDPAARRRAYQAMLDIWDHQDPPATILYASMQFYGKRRNLDWQPYPVYLMDFRRRNLPAGGGAR